MKKVKKLEKLLLIVAVAVVICGISTVNYAADDDIGSLLTRSNTTNSS